MRIPTKIIFLIIAFLLGTALAFPIGRMLGYKQGFSTGAQQTEAKYQKRIAEIYPPVTNVTGLAGTIKEIQEKALKVEVSIPTSNPFEEQGTELRTVLLTDQTKIIKQIPKTPQEYENDMNEYNRMVAQNPTTPIPYPSSVKDVELKLSDLKVGLFINIEAKENIKEKSEFEASKIFWLGGI